MKQILCLAACVLFPLVAAGQSHVVYTYDSAGNRTERIVSSDLASRPVMRMHADRTSRRNTLILADVESKQRRAPSDSTTSADRGKRR